MWGVCIKLRSPMINVSFKIHRRCIVFKICWIYVLHFKSCGIDYTNFRFVPYIYVSGSKPQFWEYMVNVIQTCYQYAIIIVTVRYIYIYTYIWYIHIYICVYIYTIRDNYGHFVVNCYSFIGLFFILKSTWPTPKLQTWWVQTISLQLYVKMKLQSKLKWMVQCLFPSAYVHT